MLADLCDLQQLFEVKLSSRCHESVESNGRKVAHSHLREQQGAPVGKGGREGVQVREPYFIWACVLHNLSAQVAALDGAKVLTRERK